MSSDGHLRPEPGQAAGDVEVRASAQLAGPRLHRRARVLEQCAGPCTHVHKCLRRQPMQSCAQTPTVSNPWVIGTHWGMLCPPKRGARGLSSSAASLGGEDGCTGAENQESEFELQPEIDLVFLLFALESR